jgi:DNA-binding response OmpR family regulator
VNIQDELDDILHAVYPAAEEKNIDFKLNYSKLPTNDILLDAASFQKIVGNLLFNAAKYTPNDGWIEIKGGTDGPNLELSIIDSGKGISSEDLPHVFDRFFQTKDTGKRLEGGSGIGLALAKELVHSMGGEITVNSEAGAGACFRLSLPFKEAKGDQAAAATAEINEARPQVQEEVVEEHGGAVATQWPSVNTSGARILIVEDNADMRDLLEELLAPTYECTSVADGQEALDIISTTPNGFDLVLSDVMMPNVDGYELLRKLKASTTTALIPLVMLTARTAERDRLQALRLGVDDYLTKPFSAEELLLRVHHIIGRVRMRESPFGTSTVVQDSVDKDWLKELEALAQEALIKQLPLNAEYLADGSHISKRTLQRHLKAATGLSMKQYILEIKLNRARGLLENKQLRTVAEITYASGFSTPAYFSRIFKERFGRRPVSYLKS